MKGALLLIGLMVCASMTEASSARWAKNRVKTIQDRLRKTSVAILAKGMVKYEYKKSNASCSDNNTRGNLRERFGTSKEL